MGDFQSSAIRSESSGLLASSICIPSGDGDLKIIQLFLEIRESKKLDFRQAKIANFERAEHKLRKKIIRRKA